MARNVKNNQFPIPLTHATPILVPPSESAPAQELPILSSPIYGSKRGTEFDDGACFGKTITETSIKSHGVINSIAIEHNTCDNTMHGGKGGSQTQTLILREDEYITEVVIRTNTYKHRNVVQCLTFKTNLGRLFGPCGDNQRKEKSTEISIIAPKCGYGLIGIKGWKGEYINAIGFHWGNFTSS